MGRVVYSIQYTVYYVSVRFYIESRALREENLYGIEQIILNICKHTNVTFVVKQFIIEAESSAKNIWK